MSWPLPKPGAGGGRTRAAFLSSTRLFSDVPADVLRRVVLLCRPRALRPRELLFREGERAAAVRLLAEGRVKVRAESAGRRVALRLMLPGDLFGAAGGWGEAVYPATGEALTDAVVLEMDGAAFSGLVAAHPAVASALIWELASRLREAEARIQELQGCAAERRLARCLLRLARRNGGAALSALSRSDLAELAGTTLGTASRTVREWHRRGIVRAGRRRIVLLEPELLEHVGGHDRGVASPAAP